MGIPLKTQFKTELKAVLQKVRDNTAEPGADSLQPILFKNVYAEHPLARDLVAEKFPAATMWGDDSTFDGNVNRSLSTTIETSIYVYFHEADFSKADEKMDYYKRDVIAAIHKNMCSWHVLIAVQVVASSNTDIFKRLGISDELITPPFYGLRIDLSVNFGSTYI